MDIPFRSQRRVIARWWRHARNRNRLLGPMDFRAAIDTVFRYLEMLAVTAVLSVVAQLGGKGAQNTVTLALCIAAGTYLTVPFWRRMLVLIPSKQPGIKRRRELVAWLQAIFISMTFSIKVSAAIVTLVSATIDFDIQKAKTNYLDLKERDYKASCVRAGMSDEQIDRCMAAVQTHFHPLPPLPRGSRLFD